MLELVILVLKKVFYEIVVNVDYLVLEKLNLVVKQSNLVLGKNYLVAGKICGQAVYFSAGFSLFGCPINLSL